MTLVGKPIPPLDHVPHAHGAPPGITVDFDFFHAWSDGRADTSRRWWTTRPVIAPIGAVVHTNAASVESSLQSSKNHGNRAQNNTKPHYNFNAPGPQKCVPSDRRAIANSTGSSIEEQYGCPDSSYWLLAFETSDRGYLASPGAPDGSGVDLGPFMYDHDELICRALAYEAIVHNFPLVIPESFYTPGVYTHTAPWGYPHLTTRRGKTCPTYTKKNQVLGDPDMMNRARELYAAWTGTAPIPQLPSVPFDPANKLWGLWPFNASKPWVKLGSQGDAVKYLQGLIFHYAGGEITIDGDFGPQTESRVKEVQSLFKLAATGSVNYGGPYAPNTWGLLEDLRSYFENPAPAPAPVPVPEPAPAPTPAPAPSPAPAPLKDYVSVGTGRYYLLGGESPWSVSEKILGAGNRYGELQAMNPGPWNPGDIIRIPDIPGRTRQVVAGDGALSVLRDFFPGSPPEDRLEDFYFWNGGEGRGLHPGDWVYCPVS